MKNDLASKCAHDKEELDKMQQGKMTMKGVVDSIGSFFHKPKDTLLEESANSLQHELDILEGLKKICKIICTVFKVEVVPAMQKRQLEQYYLFQQTFSTKQKDFLGGLLKVWEELSKNTILS